MPIYEYSCKKCGEVIEKIQKFSDPPLKKHPDCGGALTKLISKSSFQLKGSGWYVTDYADKAKKGGADTEEKSKSGDSDSKSSDSDSGSDSKKKAKSDSSEKSSPKKKPGSGTDK